MKSMMQEATSIMKAIEQAWTKAGKPRSFSVKIFEEAEHSFFGLSTKKNAKVGIFFNQADVPSTPPASSRRQEASNFAKASSRRQEAMADTMADKSPGRQDERKKEARKPKPIPEQKMAKPKKEFWTQDMISLVEQSIKEQLSLIGKSDAAFTLRANRYYLKCHFASPIFAEAEREKQLFRSWAHLLMHALRHKLRKQLRGFKLVLSSG